MSSGAFGALSTFAGLGLEIIVSKHLLDNVELVQVRFPRSKKRRIRKKWAKRRENYEERRTELAFRMGNQLLVSQRTYDALKEQTLDVRQDTTRCG